MNRRVWGERERGQDRYERMQNLIVTYVQYFKIGVSALEKSCSSMMYRYNNYGETHS